MAARGTYRHIANRLRAQIGEGELRPGEMVQSESALVERYGVARGTVRSALAVLVGEGLIEVVPGRGRRVVGDLIQAGTRTAYEQIAADLEGRVRSGEFTADAVLPSEAALVAQYGVSRATVRRAYKRLVDDRVVVVRRGIGAYPAPPLEGQQ